MRQWKAAARAVKQVPRSRRAFSSAKTYGQAVRWCESVTVPCNSNSDITLDIHHPLSASVDRDVSTRVVIYLPRGPFWSNEEQEATTLSQLGQHLPAYHTVRINYRLGSQHHYPTPVHDTLTGFDWILANILPKRAISRPGRADHVGRIAVCGELIGGGLASMLALTECRLGEPGIVAAAVSNPLVDWVSLDDMARINPEGKLENDSTTPRLLDLRRYLFPKPDRYFDPFASPLLFFRTTGAEVPSAPADVLMDDMALLSLHEREEHARQYRSNNSNDSQEAKDAFEMPTTLTTARRTSRRFPSPSLNLRLPNFHISSGSLPPFSQQSEELTHVLRQSFVRQARQATASSSFGRKVLLDDEEDELEDDDEKRLKLKQKAEADKKALLRRYQGSGLWDGSKEGRERVREMATWLRERMG